MIQSLPLLARAGAILTVLSLVYFAPLVFAAQLEEVPVSDSNHKNMIEYNSQKLDVVTINFLNAIEDVSVLYDTNNFSVSEEITVRMRLRDAFEDYFATLIPLETQQGAIVTERSREVIQDTIAEFMESEEERDRMTDIADDLDAYSKVMTESLIHTAVTV